MDINRNKGAGRLFLPEESYDNATATSEEELLEIAVQYAVDAHGHRDTPALREELRSMLRQQRRRHAA
jgi:hypothetical protein